MKIFPVIISFYFFHILLAFPEPGYFVQNLTKEGEVNVQKYMFNNSFIEILCKSKEDNKLKLNFNVKKMVCNEKAIWKDVNTETISMICRNNLFLRMNVNNITVNRSISNKLWTVDSEGNFRFVLSIKESPSNFDSVILNIKLKSWYGYLSALDYPLLIFYGVMCGVYVMMMFIWLVVLCCNWRDLLRVQFAIAAVIFLGLLEKALFVSEYHTINQTGQLLNYAILTAEIVSCVKRSLARVLIMIVCIGYGIVKPRLGPALRKIVGVGSAFCAVAVVEALIKSYKSQERFEKMLYFIPELILVLLDAVILWWSFSYLIQTIKQMRMRRNVVKFNLYRHFSNILIIVVIASIIFMIWALFTFRSSKCNSNWQYRWVNEAFWHLLFSIILMTIMFLWRPSKNNQRYAYSPLLDPEDAADTDDEEGGLDDDNDDGSDGEVANNRGSSGNKKKGRKNESIVMENLTSGKLRKQQGDTGSATTSKSAEDDLKWIEENIPASAAEKIYPIVDSDEELTPSKLTSGKMD